MSLATDYAYASMLKFNGMKKIVLFATLLGLTWCAAFSQPAHATSYSITANSGSSAPNDGNFVPSGITVTQGDSVTITFSVPSGDPYCCGAQVKGNGGQFDAGTINPGQSK